MAKNRLMGTLLRGGLKRSAVKTLSLLVALSVFLLAAPGSVLWAGDPHSAFYSSDNDRIF